MAVTVGDLRWLLSNPRLTNDMPVVVYNARGDGEYDDLYYHFEDEDGDPRVELSPDRRGDIEEPTS